MQYYKINTQEYISEIPNEETLEAMRETDEILKNPNRKCYNDLKEFWAKIEKELLEEGYELK